MRKLVSQNSPDVSSMLPSDIAAETLRLRRLYIARLILLFIMIVFMFAMIFIAVALIGEAEIPEFNNYQMTVFLIMVLLEVVAITALFFLAFFCAKVKNMMDDMKAIRPGPKSMEWCDIVKECRDTGLSFDLDIAKVSYNDDGASRAVILMRKDGTYEVVFERLHAFDEEDLLYTSLELHGFWQSVSRDKTIVDTIKQAEKIIQEDAWF